MDIAPTIPDMAKMSTCTKWPGGQVLWPSSEKVEEILEIPLNAITKDPFYWLLSFTKHEKALMEEIDKDGGCRKKSLRIMKGLREKFWCKFKKPVISSYHLKVDISKLLLLVFHWKLLLLHSLPI